MRELPSPLPPAAMSDSKGLTIGELEAKYFLYRKALKQLLLEGRSATGIEKTLCWSRLETLHNCLPRQYKSPDHIRHQLKREIEQDRERTASQQTL
jgi:hypothetical protein